MKKLKFLLTILVIYVFAFAVSYFITNAINLNTQVLNVLVFDVVATTIVFIFSLIFKNSSVYDPYWSVLPPIVGIYLMVHYEAYSVYHFIFLSALTLWGLRLTVNWITETYGWEYEDWRYKRLKNEVARNKFESFALNYLGIHMAPTMFVFLGMLPMFAIFKYEANWMTIFGSILIICGILLEHFADTSLRSFLQSKTQGSCRKGLWGYSRHPNYLGEMTIWVGVFVAMIVMNQTYWYDVVGCLSIIFMFNVISIPMAEHNLLKHVEDYKDYKKEVSRCLLLPKKKA